MKEAEPYGGPFPDDAGCLGSYPVNGEPITIELPPGSRWHRIHRKHMKIYMEDADLGENAWEDLKPIPEDAEYVTVSPVHQKNYSEYQIDWI